MENLDWGNLGFGYRKTDYNVRSYFRGGKWEELTLSTDENISMSMAASCLHYGQECFEGLRPSAARTDASGFSAWTRTPSA